MDTKDKKHYKASYPFGYTWNCLDHLQQFNRNSRESCLACKYLQFIGSKFMEQEWRSLLKEKSFKQAGTLLNSLNTFHAILEEHEKSIYQASYKRNKVNVSHSSVNVHMQVGTISKAIFAKTVIKSDYLVSPGHSVQQNE